MNHTQPENTALARATEPAALVTMGFGNLQNYEFMERTADLFSNSTMVPPAYRSMVKEGYGDRAIMVANPAAKANCMIALNMSQRMNADPLMIMQNLHIIEGRPSWSSQFIIAAINSCGRYSPLRFEFTLGEEIDATYTTFEWVNRVKTAKETKVRIRNATCVAWAVELATKTRLESPKVSMEMAVNEGWYSKNGSKWQSMPELMLRYRSAAFFGRIYAPELLMGLPSAEETRDVITVTEQPDGSYATETDTVPMARTAPPVAEYVAPAAYPDDKFATNLPAWQKVMASGRKTPDEIIQMAELKHPLTDAQKAAIRAPAEAAAKAEPTPPTFAEVADKLHAAKNQDQLNDAADLIGAVAAPDQRADLTAIYDSRLAELTV